MKIKQLKKRGLITVPPTIKEYLNLAEGDYLGFVIKNGVVQVKKVYLEVDVNKKAKK